LLHFDFQSPNFNERADGQSPSMLLLHYTGMKTGSEAIERLCDPGSKVSAHYVVEEDGRVFQLVSDDKRAWHAGVSYWAGESDINSASIGVEIVNPGHEFGYRDFPDAQIESVIKLCGQIIEKYNISSGKVMGHSDVAPGRKTDPGELFPWERLAQSGIGLWPEVWDMDVQAAPDLLESDDSYHALLCEFGYSPAEDFDVVLEAYHRHFCPERFSEDSGGRFEGVGAARLLALLRQKNALSL